MSKQIEALKKLGLTDKEIAEVLADDKRIDKGEKLFELSAEAEKASKKARTVAKAPTVYKLDNSKGKRSKKANSDKQAIINRLTATLGNWFESDSQCTYNACTNIEVANPEREFTFFYNDIKYKIVLSAPRT